jgi:ABC-type sugar transport system ATPase subunit
VVSAIRSRPPVGADAVDSTRGPTGFALDVRAAISVRGLHKTYGGRDAVRGVSFDVAPGDVFGFLGPNGAGKTTTIEILEGYRPRDGGEVRVLDVDAGRPTRRWRERIGLVLQACELDPNLTVRETVTLFASFYPSPRRRDHRARRPWATSATPASARCRAAKSGGPTSRSGSWAIPT